MTDVSNKPTNESAHYVTCRWCRHEVPMVNGCYADHFISPDGKQSMPDTEQPPMGWSLCRNGNRVVTAAMSDKPTYPTDDPCPLCAQPFRAGWDAGAEAAEQRIVEWLRTNSDHWGVTGSNVADAIERGEHRA